MPRKLFLRIDRGTIAADDGTAMSGSQHVTLVDLPEDCFQYTFESIALDHALLLLGENKSRFGFDLWHYVQSAHGLFGHISDGFVVMPNGSPDFKRRFSEDLGVAIGALFLAHTIELRLETVAQIPTNARLDKHAKIPDFVGFDLARRKRVFECKGTTAPDDVDKHRQKAKSQLAAHVEGNVTKFATVTYVPTSPKLIPPFIFVSDPPIPLPRLSLAVATGLHLLLALEFASVEAPVTQLRKMLSTWVKIDQSIADGEEVAAQLEDLLIAEKAGMLSAIQEGIEQVSEMQIDGRRIVGVDRIAENQGQKVKVFTGIDADHTIAVAQALASSDSETEVRGLSPMKGTSTGSQDGTFSKFSDGTVLFVYPLA